MSRQTQAILMTLFGAILIGITVTGRFTSYVKPGFAPLLLIAGAILVISGVAAVAVPLVNDDHRHHGTVPDGAAAPGGGAVPGDGGPVLGGGAVPGDGGPVLGGAVLDDGGPVLGGGVVPDGAAVLGDGGPALGGGAAIDHGSAHDHSHSRAPWLILAPILVLLVVSPQALGSAAVTRNAGSQALAGLANVAPVSGPGAGQAAGGTSGGYAFNDGSGHGEGTAAFAKRRPTMVFPPLPAGSKPAVGIKQFVLRALYDGSGSVTDHPVTVLGFIAPPGDGFTSGYSIARLTISCCAADASPMRVHVDGTPPDPVDTWVRAVMVARPGTASADNDYVPTADVSAMSPAAQPADPYEH